MDLQYFRVLISHIQCYMIQINRILNFGFESIDLGIALSEYRNIIIIYNRRQYTQNMAWLMFKDSGTYQPRGKKCEGLSSKAKPTINLSWGMDALDNIKNQNVRVPAQPSPRSKPTLTGIYQKKSEQEQLQKIMKKYQSKKIAQNKSIKLMDSTQADSSRHAHFRTDTQQSSQKIRFLENSLLPIQPIHRRDTMGSILNHEKSAQLDMTQSRVSRRSVSGNKKNESRVVFGDGAYNSFALKSEKQKDFHQKLLQMYQYEDQKNHRRVSQINI